MIRILLMTIAFLAVIVPNNRRNFKPDSGSVYASRLCIFNLVYYLSIAGDLDHRFLGEFKKGTNPFIQDCLVFYFKLRL